MQHLRGNGPSAQLLCPAKRYAGAMEERRFSFYSFFTSALDGGEWSASGAGIALLPGTHWIGSWVGLTAGLDTKAKGKNYGTAQKRGLQ
jgi:hypothetical protein